MLFILFALFGLWGVVIWAAQMAWIPLMAAGVINGLGHWWGYRNVESDDTSTNLTPWGLIVGGEELHNNHHAFPSSAKFSLRRFEFDIGWMMIRIFSAVRLAKVMRVAPSLDIRDDVQAPDTDTIKALLTHSSRSLPTIVRSVTCPPWCRVLPCRGQHQVTSRGACAKALSSVDAGSTTCPRASGHWVPTTPAHGHVMDIGGRLQHLMEGRTR